MGFEIGMQNALGEVTLVLFTTLGPSSAAAYLLMELPLFGSRISDEQREKISHALCIPLVLCMLGLIASATHLGNPSNALYVLSGVGRSPLSNEVFCTVVFLFFAALIWLESFALKHYRVLQRVFMVLSWASGTVFVAAVSVAYDVDTIVTWRQASIPVSIWCNALTGGPLIALIGFTAAGFKPRSAVFFKGLVAVSLVGAVGSVLSYALLGIEISGISNALVSVGELVPAYFPMVVLFAALSCVAVAIDGVPLVKGETLSLKRSCVAAIICLAAIFTMRFSFYMMHMTVGVAF